MKTTLRSGCRSERRRPSIDGEQALFGGRDGADNDPVYPANVWRTLLLKAAVAGFYAIPTAALRVKINT